jgi:hypothetical protein
VRYLIFPSVAALLLAAELVVAQETEAERDLALAVVKRLGGSFRVDEEAPGKPIVMVDLRAGKTTDADLAQLKGLTRLQTLNLNLTKVTDAGLVHLKGMMQLEELGLGMTAVGDAGTRVNG